jgi:1-aminocyclopropane-1-carboxylate deaminase/D-cysteine desulfhydrase-like pyridoxal-dependent ACC family enzyme
MNDSTEAISEILAGFPRAGLALEPTPIHPLPRLSAHLGRTVCIMRDDLVGFGIGGNKVRKLDFLVGEALARGADTLLTSVASSFSRNAAVAGKVHGLEVHVVLGGTVAEQNRASQALFERVGAILHYAPHPGQESIRQTLHDIQANLENQGKSVYPLHPGGSDPIGCLGYFSAFNQVIRHSLETGVHFSHIIHATGSTATQAGLVLGQCVSGYETTIIGMAASQPTDIQRGRVLELARDTAAMLEIELDESRIVVDDGFLGPGYALPSERGNEACRLFAGLEGILLDDAYTAKAAAGLIHHAERGSFENGAIILFLHTSGDAGLYY